MTFIVGLEDCAAALAPKVGGKSRGLHFLFEQKLPVPRGFAVTTDAYRACVAAAGLEAQIAQIACAATSPMECQAASGRIRALFQDSVMLADVARDIAVAYAALDGGRSSHVAVRSSATAEDTAEASFAGQQDTYLHICGASAVQQHIVKCWASLFTAQAIGYRARFKVPHDGLAMAVVVQRMVAAEAAGVMMSLDPVNGDHDSIYIESALGLGEGVVRGDVGCDRYWVSKASLMPIRQEVNAKQSAHRFDAESGGVRLVPVAADEQDRSSLQPDEIATLAAMARQAERAFGSPVDMEWAVGRNAQGRRAVFLLQARPETVWASKPKAPKTPEAESAAVATEIGSLEAWDNLHSFSSPELHWSTSNFGEAVPGVATPLSWSVWGPALESAMRGSVYAIGGLDSSERRLPASRNDWFARSFFGRPAMNVKYLATVGDRMPGTTGQAVVRDLLGNVPPDMQFRHTMRRYPAIAWRLPWTFITTPGKVRRAAADTDAFWLASTARIPSMDHATTVETMAGTVARFTDAVTLQATLLLGSISPLYDAIAGLVKHTGVGDTAALSGFGGAEMDVVGDIFQAARGRMPLDEVVRRHGFHGPMEGELSSTVWREDPSPLKKLLADYAARDESADPRRQGEQRRKAAAHVEAQLLAALPALKRPAARLLLKLAARRIPMRGIPKRSFLQLFDVLRVCARRLGELLVAEGRLQGPDDVFYLTIDELCKAFPDDAKALVVKRRARRAAYTDLRVPTEWQGMPAALHARAQSTGDDSLVRGIGVSPGVVEGRARVLSSPDFAEVGSGEILVTPTTDPSWSSVMFISAGLVVDIGGALSHAAIVARELGLPCVVNTRNGSQVLRTGDLLRVDGAAGTVQILKRSTDR